MASEMAVNRGSTLSPTRATGADLDWFIANFQQLVAEYPDHWLAICDQKVLAAARETKELRERIKELGIDRPLIVRSHPNAWDAVK